MLAPQTPRRAWVPALAAACAIVVIAAVAIGSGRPQEGRAVPAPAVDEHANASSAIAVLAGGCFWGVQGVFQHVTGVTSAVSGYAGGPKNTANYPAVSTGGTGHAESVQITYDPRQISYGRLLQLYFSVAHDPTQLNRQGPDEGTQYRSAIFPTTADQTRIARAYIEQLTAARAFDGRIVTTIEPEKVFYPAEAYHQDYLTRHPNAPYIVINDLPKIEDLKRLFPGVYRREPVLVGSKER